MVRTIFLLFFIFGKVGGCNLSKKWVRTTPTSSQIISCFKLNCDGTQPPPDSRDRLALEEEGGEIFVLLFYFEFQTCIKPFLLLARSLPGCAIIRGVDSGEVRTWRRGGGSYKMFNHPRFRPHDLLFMRSWVRTSTDLPMLGTGSPLKEKEGKWCSSYF